MWTLSGEAEIDYRNYIVRADKITYNEAIGTVEAVGHLHLEGGPDEEQIDATRGTMNLDAQTGHFYDVSGSIGVRRVPATNSKIYTTSNPFLMTGREVFKDGPERYRVLDGTMTSCHLPKPDWQLLSAKINVADGKATARSTWFTLLRIPLIFLPYVTHPVNTESRQSGLLIPVISNSTTKGVVLGDQIYWVINRSADLTIGTEYYSKRGFAPSAELRYRGKGLDFATANFHALFDRGLPSGLANVPPIDQGGQDVIINARRDFTPQIRAVTNIEYLSSYVYRQAFEPSIVNATNSEVKSEAFVQHEDHGVAESVYLARYQSFQSDTAGDEIRILHLPSFQASAIDHSLWSGRLLGSFAVSLDTLTRSEPLFHARNLERIDLHPRLALPLGFGGWNIRTEIGGRETFYSKSELLPSTLNGEVSPTLQPGSLNRADFETDVDLRPPVVQRDFSAPWMEKLFGGDVRHTIEPDLHYRYVTGVGNFNSVLRVDNVDIVSNTNEIEYGLTQRFFVRNTATHPCRDDEPQTPSGMCGGGAIDRVSWQLAQKYFFDSDFGGAVTEGARNVLATTLDFSGAAFLEGPRSSSPVISRLRLATTSSSDVQWDLDYDPKVGRINSSNIFADLHYGDLHVAAGQFKLVSLDAPVTSPQTVTAAVTRYNQARLSLSYGNSKHAGFGAGVNGGYDFIHEQVQFGTIQASYNWDCCGISVGYRRYSLGPARDESQMVYSITLAGVATAGNFRQSEKVF
ncbi:Outer membrane protein Imp, required for envelope biogenesis / Organic solvent tolerance protein precursor [Acidisarcina polymorpha]|uniref:Outer membrane protein Imp, required for envelope biogenesis / Organic solvent tolerance protein n=1 Tax=Acidisarcina polymorpha TaxID=2211140 RepID=A0A2Z5FY39_9BACT|nr:Outer membrane protein Imp, required for envelope biogenesis / Organic solvent tolerance protein precursor [Acidisarcina polymorpha]